MAANEAKTNLTNSWHSFHAMSGPILVNNLLVENVTGLFADFLSKPTSNLGPVDVNPLDLDLPDILPNRIETSTWSYTGEFSNKLKQTKHWQILACIIVCIIICPPT